MIVSLAVLVPWVAGVVAVALDGRRRGVGWGSVAVLAVTARAARRAHGTGADGTGEGGAHGWWLAPGSGHRAARRRARRDLRGAVGAGAAGRDRARGAGRVRERVFPGLLLAGGLTGLFLTGDVFNFYVFFELAMTASYALTTYGGKRRQLRAALVFTAVNLLGSFIFLLSVAGTYRVTGHLAMREVAERMPGVDPNAAILVAAGFFIAFSVKLGLFPFHFWPPTVYAGSRPAVAAILSGAVANIGAYGYITTT